MLRHMLHYTGYTLHATLACIYSTITAYLSVLAIYYTIVGLYLKPSGKLRLQMALICSGLRGISEVLVLQKVTAEGAAMEAFLFTCSSVDTDFLGPRIGVTLGVNYKTMSTVQASRVQYCFN